MELESETGRRLRCQQRRNYVDDGDDVVEGKRTFSVQEKLESPKFERAKFVKSMHGSEFNLKYIQENGFRFPILFKSTEGLGLRMPSKDFTVNDVKNFVGARRIVDVFEVNTQQASEMTMQHWVKYFTAEERTEILNVISLEFSHTRLEEMVESPEVVRQIDWVDIAWPPRLIDEQRDSTNNMADMKYPKVKKYCLMSVAGCYTDFHIDFGGTSVWYHILKGEKIFWVIQPTPKNLARYEKWVLSGRQQDMFFGDQVEECERVHLVAGDTFLIPTGWIHAVHTPKDSLVFGGNYLHSYAIPEQITVSQIEDTTKVPQKFRYPMYGEIMWYVAERYVQCLEKNEAKKLLKTNEESNGKLPLTIKTKLSKTSPATYAVKQEMNDLPINANAVRLENGHPDSPKKESSTTPTSEDDGRPRRSNRVARGEECSARSDESAEEGRRRRSNRLTKSESLARECRESSGIKSKVNFEVEERGKMGRTSAASKRKAASSEEKENTERATKKRKVGRNIDETEKELPVEQEKSAKELQNDKAETSGVSDECNASSSQPQVEHAYDGEEDKENKTIEREWVPVFLTPIEIRGLRQLIERLKNWPTAQKNVPTSVEQPERLLQRLEELVKLHENDDPILAVSGVQPLLQVQEKPRRVGEKMKLKSSTPRPPKIGTKVGPGIQRRRTRCRQCESCKREDCGECRTCKDMKKFGGAGRMKQACLIRACDNPTLPTCVRCAGCGGANSDEEMLMECSLCGEIIHPHCLDHQGPYKIVTDINNCWECPKCCKDKTAEFHKGIGHHVTAPRIVRKRKETEDIAKEATPKKIRSRTRQPSESSDQESEDLDNDSGISEESEDASSEVLNSLHESPPTPAAEPSAPPTPPGPPPEVLPKYVIRPHPISSPKEFVEVEDGSKHMLNRNAWLRIFGFLTQSQLCVCMRVCRTWNRWAMDHRFWLKLELFQQKLSQFALMGIVRRQPNILDLSWTNVTFKQLLWLLNRLPRIQELCVQGSTQATVSALGQVNCPRIKVLDLRWSVGVVDSLLKEIISPPPPTEGRAHSCETKSRLSLLAEIRLAGCDVTGQTLRTLVRYCDQLTKVDFSYCPGIADDDIDFITSFDSPLSRRLTEVDFTGCPKLSDAILHFLKRCDGLRRVDLRGCKQISVDGVKAFTEICGESVEIVEGKLVIINSN